MKKYLLVALTFGLLTAFPALAAVNINTASVARLESVRGIGPAKARAIIEYRKEHGPFQRIEELDNVRGFGAKTIYALRKELTVGTPLPATTAAPQPSSRGTFKIVVHDPDADPGMSRKSGRD